MGATKKFMEVAKKVIQAPALAAAEAEAKAAEQYKATADAQTSYQQSMLNMQREAQSLSANNGADLTTSNISNVVAGGTADATSYDSSALKKRKGGGLSSQLGINV